MPGAEAQQLFADAVEAGRRRDYGAAIELLGRLIAEGGAGPEVSLYLGRALYAAGQLGPSIEAFRRFLREGGSRAVGLFFLGRALLACERPNEALRALRASAEAAPERAATWALLGAALLRLRRTKAAVDCLERAVGLAPEDKRIYRGYLNALYARGVRLAARGDSDLAQQILGFAVENGLDGPAIRLWRARALRDAGHAARALVDCEAALAASPDDSSIRWLHAGLLLAAGHQAEALREFEAIRLEHPELPSLPTDDLALARLRASVAFREGRYRQALPDCLAILRSNPKDAALRAIAAESLRLLGEPERARNHWQRAIEAAPEEAGFRLGLSAALFDLGDYEGSLRAAERARKLGAAAEADYQSALCRSRLGQDPEQLIPLLQELLRRRNRATATGDSAEAAGDRGARVDVRLMFALGEALYRTGRPDLAEGWFAKVLSVVPDHEMSLLYCISSAESLGKEEARYAAYRAYLDRYPDNDKLRREYIDALVGSGDWASAAEQIEASLAYARPDHGRRRLLAAAYRNAGRYREAAIAYRDLLREQPESGELLVGLAFSLDKEGRGDYALALLEKAPVKAKAGPEPWIAQAALYSRSDRVQEAASALRAALDRDRGCERAWKALITLYRKRGLTELAANAEEEARTALSAARRPSKSARDAASPPQGLADMGKRGARQ